VPPATPLANRPRKEGHAGCQTRVMAATSRSELRDLYDQQVRRNTNPDNNGSIVDHGPTFVRWAAHNGVGWSEVLWSSLKEDDADEAIAAHIEFYTSRGLSFMWGVYDYDLPVDLGTRLLNAGFLVANSSTVMIGESRRMAQDPKLPDGTELVRIRDAAGVDLLITVHESVFAHDQQDLRRSILRRLQIAPEETDMFVVTADGAPISSSRIEYLPSSEFAALWGGSTEPQWRGKGIYRAQVSRRAQLAAERGYQYLMVLASENSRPILTALGFETISHVTRYLWKADDAS
jgi:GNAT superfamily N-acetyltransferase